MVKLRRFAILAVAAGAIAMTVSVGAHDTPNIDHTHAFKQTGYGTWRQGHSVDGPQGSIIIWSPQPYTEYRGARGVRFARPQPITKAPGSPVKKPGAGQKPVFEPNKPPTRNYGN